MNHVLIEQNVLHNRDYAKDRRFIQSLVLSRVCVKTTRVFPSPLNFVDSLHYMNEGARFVTQRNTHISVERI